MSYHMMPQIDSEFWRIDFIGRPLHELFFSPFLREQHFYLMKGKNLFL